MAMTKVCQYSSRDHLDYEPQRCWYSFSNWCFVEGETRTRQWLVSDPQDRFRDCIEHLFDGCSGGSDTALSIKLDISLAVLTVFFFISLCVSWHANQCKAKVRVNNELSFSTPTAASIMRNRDEMRRKFPSSKWNHDIFILFYASIRHSRVVGSAAQHEADWPIVVRVYAPNQQREAPETEDHDSSTRLPSWLINWVLASSPIFTLCSEMPFSLPHLSNRMRRVKYQHAYKRHNDQTNTHQWPENWEDSEAIRRRLESAIFSQCFSSKSNLHGSENDSYVNSCSRQPTKVHVEEGWVSVPPS